LEWIEVKSGGRNRFKDVKVYRLKLLELNLSADRGRRNDKREGKKKGKEEG
jgi:hypothetical protein